MSLKSVCFGLAVLVSASSVSMAQSLPNYGPNPPPNATALANRQAVPNRQACRATDTALTRMSRTSIAVTTGIGITATGIGESGAAQRQLGAGPRSGRWDALDRNDR